MKQTKKAWLWSAVASLVLLAGFASTAQAYIDPGSGSYIFQVLVGVLVGSAVAIKVFWQKIFAFLTRGRARKG